MNKQFFTNIDAATKFIGAILQAAQDDKYCINEIKVTPEDAGSVVVEWNTVYKDSNAGFKWLNDDQDVMTRVEHPDGHYEYVFPEEADKCAEQWEKDHPEWERTSYGTWTNMEENRTLNIEWRFDDWKDSPLVPKAIQLSTTKDPITLTDIFNTGFEDTTILAQTNFIVGGDSLLKGFGCELEQKKVTKIGTYRVNWNNNEHDIHLYYKPGLGKMFYFISKNMEVLAKLNVEIQE